jgi:hypothetical protein
MLRGSSWTHTTSRRFGVALDLVGDLLLREGVEQLDARDRDRLVALAGGVALEVVEDLARAEDQAGDLLLVDPRLGEHGVEPRVREVLDPRGRLRQAQQRLRGS